MTNASYTAARCWPVARIVATPEEFRATVDLEGSDDTDVDVELVGHTVRLTGRGLDPGTLRFELRFELPPDADTERLRVVEEHGRLLVSAPCCAPRLRKLEIEHAGQLSWCGQRDEVRAVLETARLDHAVEDFGRKARDDCGEIGRIQQACEQMLRIRHGTADDSRPPGEETVLKICAV